MTWHGDSEIDLRSRRYKQLLGFIAELDRLRSRVVTRVEENVEAIRLSDLPQHPCVEFNKSDPSRFLTVTRCEPPESPSLPDLLREWINYTKNQIAVEPTPRNSISKDDSELHWEDDGPIDEWEDWLNLWRTWAELAKPAFFARDLYGSLYELHAVLQKSPDELELVAADVMVALGWVDHPFLISPVQLDFDPQRLTIAVGCLEEPSQVYGDAIRTVLPDCGESISRARKEVGENPDLWAFGGDEVNKFARKFVQGAHPDGVFVVDTPPRDRLSARRQPWLILRRRVTGLAELAEGLKAKFEEDGHIPYPIRPVLMDEAEPELSDFDFHGEPDEDEEAYFTKPANQEQLAILRVFRRRGRVHVQGPPGTGKTHTIANLIGHFLAEGKSVLVTSEKAQALAVLRDKVVEELQPLCVSLVGSDAGEGLKAGMRSLFDRLGSTVPERLRNQIDRLNEARRRTIADLRQTRNRMREIIENEHLPVEVRNWRGSPTQAGKYVNEHRERMGWIRGDVTPNSEPPLSQTEFEELLALLDDYPGELASEARKPLPAREEVPLPEVFRELLQSIHELEHRAPERPDPAVVLLRKQCLETEQVRHSLDEIEKVLSHFRRLDLRYVELANRILETPALGKSLRSILQEASTLSEKKQRIELESAPYDFRFSEGRPDLLTVAHRLLHRVKQAGKPMRKPSPFDREAKAFFDEVKALRPLGEESTLRAFIELLEFRNEYDAFCLKVRAFAGSIALSGLDGSEPERALMRDEHLQLVLRWTEEHHAQIIHRLGAIGLRYEPTALVGSANKGPAVHLAIWLEKIAQPTLEEYQRNCELEEAQNQLSKLCERAKQWLTGEPSETLKAVANAVLGKNPDAYERAFDELAQLRDAIEPVERRDSLLKRLSGVAKQFAISLENGDFDKSSIRTRLSEAWTYALIYEELRRRNALSLEQTKEDLERLKRQLDKTTIELASARAWEAQHRRVTQPVSSALSRFHEAQRKIGAGKGRRVPELLREMRRAMRDAKDAFPVWIMPLYDLTRSFDFTRTKFDVVIVDEASQLSAVGLTTLLIAESAIVVGDDEQTEPSLTGVPYDTVKALIDEHLVDFPDRVLWSPDSSLYSFAGRFGAMIVLREHFRCVPQIISFSSKLCYQGKIHPLRESRGVLQVPHVVPISCYDASTHGVENANDSEALEIASLVLSCYCQEEYRDQTFGVIALRGSADSRGMDPQTERVAHLIRQALDPSEWEHFISRHKFKCGVPSAFQGDERDVVFISVGDSPNSGFGSGPMRLIADNTIPGSQYKKRLNVAVSRARNQVWVAHSFRHYEAELQKTDIRRSLLEFAYAPEIWLESTLAQNPKAESPFEQAVFADLVRLGFTVTPQVPVGHFRIDLVVENEKSRVALECDGDAYHQDPAADLARQLVLERCGWKFVRIRGSEYYQNPKHAIDRVVFELHKLGATPSQTQPEQKEPEGVLLETIRARAQEIRDALREGHPNIVREIQGHMAKNAQAVRLTVHSDEPDDIHREGDRRHATSSVESRPTPLSNPLGITDNPISLNDDREGVTDLNINVTRVGAESRPIDLRLGYKQPKWLHFEEYQEFLNAGFEDPKNLTQAQIQSDLLEIVSVEGPATENRIIDRYRVAIGYGRLKDPTRERVLTALRSAVRLGRLRAIADYPGSAVQIYSMPDQPELRPRKRGPREFEDIPMGEIVEAIRQVLKWDKYLSGEGLDRKILEVFDLRRLTELTKARIETAVSLARRTTGATDNKTTYQPTPQPDHKQVVNVIPSGTELTRPKPLKDKNGRVVRVRVVGASGTEVIRAGTIVGKKELGNRVEWAVLVDETGTVRKFLSPPAKLLRLS